jgi:hypothetical protein
MRFDSGAKKRNPWETAKNRRPMGIDRRPFFQAFSVHLHFDQFGFDLLVLGDMHG